MSFSRVLFAPFRCYNNALEKYPLTTKSITSGAMYAAGDLIAQYSEAYSSCKPGEEKVMKWNKNRTLAFLIFGTVIGGPLYHYWFNYLNELPALLWQMKQTQHRDKILRAYAYLKAHGIQVKLDLANLPKAAPLDKWKSKAAKLLADQGIFAPIYDFVIFIIIGMLVGGLDKRDLETENTNILKQHKQVVPLIAAAQPQPHLPSNNISDERKSIALEEENTDTLLEWLEKLRSSLSDKASAPFAASATAEENITSLDIIPDELHMVENIIQIIRNKEKEKEREGMLLSSSPAVSGATTATVPHTGTIIGLQEVPSWSSIWEKTFAHTKEVYLMTYLTDCLVWPPLQLINFTFIPVNYQFLFVNLANIAWNAYLSWMANSGNHSDSDEQGNIHPAVVVAVVEVEGNEKKKHQ